MNPFYLQKDNIFCVPSIHYCMEMALAVRQAFLEIKPDCVAVELPENMSPQILRAASRLPEISIIASRDLFVLAEPADPAFEALRSAQQAGVKAFCIDLDVENYPEHHTPYPDPYAISRIGLEKYYSIVKGRRGPVHHLDSQREETMARRLKELSLSFDRVLFVGGIFHMEAVLQHLEQKKFSLFNSATSEATLATLTEDSRRDVMAEWGYLTLAYEAVRENGGIADRQKVIFNLYKEAGQIYQKEQFAGYHLRNLLKYVRNLSFWNDRLMPDLFQILTAAKGCVDHNFAYETWKLATDYPHNKNIDNLPELSLSAEQVWGRSKRITFHLKHPSRKEFRLRKKKDISKFRFNPPGPFTICSFPPEDVAIEAFGEFLQKKGTELARDEEGKTVPFTTSLEDGIDMRETIRHFWEKKLFVKMKGRKKEGVGSVVVVFDEDIADETSGEKFSWHTTWLGEHEQESDMAFYATPLGKDVVGPGISRCIYGGFMMSYPPRRMRDIWNDPDYRGLRSKGEILLAAAIDYACKPVVVYVAAKPPRTLLKRFASRFGKKVVYIPIGQLSPLTLKKLQSFHVLDGHDKREIAGEYIDL